jgi:hypothetical protein
MPKLDAVTLLVRKLGDLWEITTQRARLLRPSVAVGPKAVAFDELLRQSLTDPRTSANVDWATFGAPGALVARVEGVYAVIPWDVDSESFGPFVEHATAATPAIAAAEAAMAAHVAANPGAKLVGVDFLFASDAPDHPVLSAHSSHGHGG